MKKSLAVLALVALSVACGSNSQMMPTGPSGTTAMSGTWSGSASDSSSSMGAGSMMGQAGAGTMTSPLTQNGAAVTGTMTFSGMQGRMPGTFTGTMSGDDMTFTMDMPDSSMMSSGCSARATGTAHVDASRTTMTGTYSGSNSCTGAFTGGQMTMVRR